MLLIDDKDILEISVMADMDMDSMYQKKVVNDRIYIQGILEDMEICMVPEKIGGSEVAGIEDFAFAERRQLQSVSLPENILKIGAHAFYNCRSLRSVSLYDGVTDIGDGAFKNCYSLHTLNLVRKHNHTKCLKGILLEINNEIIVNITCEDGTASLLFPYYMHNYVEDTPARIINQVTEGCGVRYRECIGSEDINYSEYDRIFLSAIHTDIQDASARLAMGRLKYPYRLSKKAEHMYRQYLYEGRFGIAEGFIKDENYEYLKELVNMKLFDADDMRRCIDMCRTSANMEALGILLECQRELYGTARKVFEL